MSVLVCGGAGYIGSHTVWRLIENEKEVVVVDNLQTGHREAIHPKAKFYQGDIRDKAFLDNVFQAESIDSVVHFAADSQVGESMKLPLKYFGNNVYGMQVLLETMVKHKTRRIVFSSTAAVYGEPQNIPILETDPTIPQNPYGESKLMMERMMHWVEKAHNINFVSLRYFNAAGAMPGGNIGEDHHPETHLIPLVLAVPLKKKENIVIFGDDYDTPDGTCLRDYVHVWDLASAHILALKYLQEGGKSDIFNLGNGKGFSVKEIIEGAKKVTGTDIPATIGKRRPGDPARLIASSEKATRILGWEPELTDINKIIATAWAWHKQNLYAGKNSL